MHITHRDATEFKVSRKVHAAAYWIMNIVDDITTLGMKIIDRGCCII
jgi:hypothetical protein